MNDPYNRHRLYRHYPWSAKSEVEWYPLYQACGCDMCTGRIGRKRNRRKERMLWKRNCHEALKLNHEAIDDWDPPFTITPCWY